MKRKVKLFSKIREIQSFCGQTNLIDLVDWKIDGLMRIKPNCVKECYMKESKLNYNNANKYEDGFCLVL